MHMAQTLLNGGNVTSSTCRIWLLHSCEKDENLWTDGTVMGC